MKKYSVRLWAQKMTFTPANLASTRTSPKIITQHRINFWVLIQKSNLDSAWHFCLTSNSKSEEEAAEMEVNSFNLLMAQELRPAEGTNGMPLSFPISLWSIFFIFFIFGVCIIARRHCRGIFNNAKICNTYLRSMTKADARHISKMHIEKHGMNGMLGSLDCMQISWKNCPSEQKGHHARKDQKPTLALEAVADNSLWFWHHDFGFPGALNDINIWDRSELCKSFVDGTLNELDFLPFFLMMKKGDFFMLMGFIPN